MKIIVTGGCGFIGSTLIKKLIKHSKNKILNLDSLNYESIPESLFSIKSNKNYFFKKININNKEKLLQLFFDFKPNIVFHLAGIKDSAIIGEVTENQNTKLIIK